ncbi:MAG TPA: 5-oxoprolinase subunit PxpA [Gemmatimonadaceae bacterium]|nr:5-oxoprolinase subunit PxpA [Gemmatimonadaceae bacterium]
MLSIDLNADLGEGFGHYVVADEGHVLPLVTSASIACGFHAGDPLTMRRSVRLALDHGVTVGAHPGYPDLLGFGRRDLGATPEEVTAYVLYQVGALAAVCHAERTVLRYVKPHGALYNRAATDAVVAAAVAEGVRLADPTLVLLGLAGSALVSEGQRAGLRTAAEAFADRAYLADGTLAPRSRPGAVLTDEAAVVEQALGIVREQRVATLDGGSRPVHADSLCVHGDNPRAPALLRALRRRLNGEGITIASFAG